MKNPLRLLCAVVVLFVAFLSACKKEESAKPVVAKLPDNDTGHISKSTVGINQLVRPPRVDTFFQPPNFSNEIFSFDTVFIVYERADSIVIYSNKFGPENRSFITAISNIHQLAESYSFYYETDNTQFNTHFLDSYTLSLRTYATFFTDSTFSAATANTPLLICSYDQEWGCAGDYWGVFIGNQCH